MKAAPATRMVRSRSARSWRRGVLAWLAGVVATPTVERCSSVASMSAGGAEAWAAAGPAIDGCGTRRDSGPSVDRMPPQWADCPQNALQNEERGMSRANEGSAAPERTGGRTGCPQAVRPRADDATVQTIVTEAWLGRMSVGAFVFHAVAVSLNDDRLPVLN